LLNSSQAGPAFAEEYDELLKKAKKNADRHAPQKR